MSSRTVAIEENYRGALGATRRQRVHWACPCGVLHSIEVVVGIDCAADPELASALRDGRETFNQAVCPTTGARGRVDVPVVYHDPDEPLFVLVLPAGARARELHERAALLERLARDVEHDVPPYVAGFAAVHEAAGLRAHLGRAVMDTRGVYGVEGAVTLPRMRVVAREIAEDEAITSPRMPAVLTELVTIAEAADEAGEDDEVDTRTMARRSASADQDAATTAPIARDDEPLATGQHGDAGGDRSGESAGSDEAAPEAARGVPSVLGPRDAGEPTDLAGRQAPADPEKAVDALPDEPARATIGARHARAGSARADVRATGSPTSSGERHTRPGFEPASADLDDVMGAIDAAIAAIDGPTSTDPDRDGSARADDPARSWADGDDATATGAAAVGDEDDAGSDGPEPDPASAAVAYAAAAGAYRLAAEDAGVGEAARHGGRDESAAAVAAVGRAGGHEDGAAQGDAQAVEHADAPAAEQGDAQTVAQGDAQTVEQGDGSAAEQGDAQAVVQGDAQSVEQGDAQRVEQGEAQAVEQGDAQAAEHADALAVRRSGSPAVHRAIGSAPHDSDGSAALGPASSAAHDADAPAVRHTEGSAARRGQGAVADHAEPVAADQADPAAAPHADGAAPYHADGAAPYHGDGAAPYHADGAAPYHADGAAAYHADGAAAYHADDRGVDDADALVTHDSARPRAADAAARPDSATHQAGTDGSHQAEGGNHAAREGDAAGDAGNHAAGVADSANHAAADTAHGPDDQGADDADAPVMHEASRRAVTDAAHHDAGVIAARAAVTDAAHHDAGVIAARAAVTDTAHHDDTGVIAARAALTDAAHHDDTGVIAARAAAADAAHHDAGVVAARAALADAAHHATDAGPHADPRHAAHPAAEERATVHAGAGERGQLEAADGGAAARAGVAARMGDQTVEDDSSVSAAWSAAAAAGVTGVGLAAGERRAAHAVGFEDGAGEGDPDDELDSIDLPIHVAGEGTGIGPSPLDGAGEAAPDPTSSRRVGADGRVTIGLVAEGAELAALVAAELEVRLQLHRMSNFPLLALVFGDAAALDGAEGTSPPRWVLLDIGDEEDRAALHALGRLFEVHLEIQDGSRDGVVVATSLLSPPLADNVLAALAAAADYLKGIPLDQRSFPRARAAFRAPEYDRLGLATSLAGELDEDVLRGLATPAQVVRAVALVKRFSQPTGEDWLLMSRSYPLESWQSSRRAVVKRAFELGIWPGPVAAQIAVGEGLARSRKELVMRLQRNFTALLDQPADTAAATGEAPAESLPAPAHDLEDGPVRENWKALKAEARALGVPAGEWSQPRSSPIVSESAPIASGTIDLFAEAGEESGGFARPGRRRARTAAYGEPVGGDGIGGGRPRGQRHGGLGRLDSAALVDALEDRDRRLAAAMELCRRGEESAAGAIFAAVDGLSRAEAGLLLGSVGFLGRAAEPHLLAGLRSRKAHIRQGSALALAVMRSEAGVEAICDLLLDDPTAIWRELARALGETGAIAVMPLAARLGQRSMAARERAAWALAHIGARGHRRPLEALAAGRDQVAAGVARRAIELIEAAQSDDLAVRGDRAPRDQTMNRSFSRRFFEAVRAERRAAAEAAAADAAADSETEVEPAAARAVAGRATAMTSGTAVLDESDILDAVDVEGEGEVEVDDKMEVEVADDAGDRDRAPG